MGIEPGVEGEGVGEENCKVGGGAKNNGESEEVPTSVAAQVATLPTIGIA